MAARPSKNLSLQKDTERRHIELFLELAGLGVGLEFGDRPDCVLVLPDRRIGLEHRELFDQDLQASRPHLQRLGGILKSELEARGVAVHVKVYLSPRSAWLDAHPRRFVPLAQRIAGLAATVQPAPGAELAISGEELADLGIEGPRLLALQKVDGQSRPSVRIEGGPIEGELAHRVIEAIRSKEAKLSGYARSADLSHHWLLLVTGETLPQTMAAMRMADPPIDSQFDRVYVLDVRERRLLCVKGSQSSASASQPA